MSRQLHPTSRLDDVVHQRARLGVLAVLAESRRADFGFLRDTLDLTDGNLSRHLQVLDGAGYVEIDKVFEHRKPRTWVRITVSGKRALAAEIASLQELMRRIDGGGR